MKGQSTPPLASPLDGALRGGVLVYLAFSLMLPVAVLLHRGFAGPFRDVVSRNSINGLLKYPADSNFTPVL